MNISELIQQKYGDMYKQCPPLDEEKYPLAEKMLPTELSEVLKTSNGFLELMSLPDVDDGKPFASDYIIYPFEDMCAETGVFHELYGAEGVVFAGNGAGGYYVIAPDGDILLYEYVGEDGEHYADSIEEYIQKVTVCSPEDGSGTAGG